MRNICKIENCTKFCRGLGYCDKHYLRFIRYGSPNIVHTRTKQVCKIEGCNNFCKGHGYCSKHWERWNTHGDPNYQPPTIEERYNSFVDKKGINECWNWKGDTKSYHGYGKFHFAKKKVQAHRYTWELFNGIIPEGMLICHSCDNPSCVNPNHLFLGTSKDNTVDMMKKGRHNNQWTK